ncbi:MAG: DsbA family protein, partial [archaeon]|nr:DsbA family protein [archaeon]
GVKEQKPELFWEFAEKAFASPNDLSNTAKMKELAVSIGADAEELDAYLASQKYAAQLKKETEEGSAKGVTGTPAFFINGELVSGAQPYSVFERVIESKL